MVDGVQLASGLAGLVDATDAETQFEAECLIVA